MYSMNDIDLIVQIYSFCGVFSWRAAVVECLRQQTDFIFNNCHTIKRLPAKLLLGVQMDYLLVSTSIIIG